MWHLSWLTITVYERLHYSQHNNRVQWVTHHIASTYTLNTSTQQLTYMSVTEHLQWVTPDTLIQWVTCDTFNEWHEVLQQLTVSIRSHSNSASCWIKCWTYTFSCWSRENATRSLITPAEAHSSRKWYKRTKMCVQCNNNICTYEDSLSESQWVVRSLHCQVVVNRHTEPTTQSDVPRVKQSWCPVHRLFRGIMVPTNMPKLFSTMESFMFMIVKIHYHILIHCRSSIFNFYDWCGHYWWMLIVSANSAHDARARVCVCSGHLNKSIRKVNDSQSKVEWIHDR